MGENDLISRAEAMDIIRSMTISLGGKEIFHPEAKKSVLSALDTLPAVDAEPVRHGRWIPEIVDYTLSMAGYEPDGEDIIYKCSRCGREEKSIEPYCHCGAKMDEERAEV